jgi:hypothetical protein
MKQTKSKNISMLKAVIITIPPMVKAAPILFILNSLISILHGISFAWITICTQNFLDKAAVFAKNEISIHKVIFSLSV